jgi:hypothetical protein
MPFFLMNLTRGKVMEWESKNFPPSLLEIAGFIKPGDILEIAEVVDKKLNYRGLIDYIEQTTYTHGMERVNEDGSDYVDAATRAAQWLAEKKKPTIKTPMPRPRCGTCKAVCQDMASVQCIRDSGKCLECRVPKFSVYVPQGEKSNKRRL